MALSLFQNDRVAVQIRLKCISIVLAILCGFGLLCQEARVLGLLGLFELSSLRLDEVEVILRTNLRNRRSMIREHVCQVRRRDLQVIVLILIASEGALLVSCLNR